MFKKLLFALNVLSLSSICNATPQVQNQKSEDQIAKEWLALNSGKVSIKKNLDFVVCEAGQ